MTEPCQEVFNVAELLELILLSLPPKDILLLQRVSKFWKGTVTGSLKLQQALFLKDDGNAGGSHDGNILRNPLLEPLFPPNSTDHVRVNSHGDITLHPSWAYAEASWHSMLLCKPAWVDLSVRAHIWAGLPPMIGENTVMRDVDGVKARDVMVWIQQRPEDVYTIKMLERAKAEAAKRRVHLPAVSTSYNIVPWLQWREYPRK